MAQLTTGLQWLRAHLLPTLLALAVASALVYYQFAQSGAQARLTEAQQRLQVVQVQALRVEQREKKTQSAQQVVDSLQNNLLEGDIYYGRLSAVQRAEKESGVRVIAYAPSSPEAIGAAPALQPPVNAQKPPSETDQVAAVAQPAQPKPAPAPAPATGVAGTYKRYPVVLAVEGSYSGVLAFARSLERGSPVARLDKLELHIQAGNKSTLAATVYFYGP